MYKQLHIGHYLKKWKYFFAVMIQHACLAGLINHFSFEMLSEQVYL